MLPIPPAGNDPGPVPPRSPAPADPRRPADRVVVTTGNDVAGREIAEYLGVVRGIVVRSPSIAQGFLGGMKQFVGGNNETFTEVCEAARDEAFRRMLRHATELGAAAVVAFRYDATEFSPGVTEVLAYGTAVRLK